ncbi:MAG: hypothetical protein HC771_14155 [Synechococcales cyanobacterium CRU_2_2]|nr:hypothetical protein [Synechococcales cyanobacterium CRU_2_2]
MDTAAIPSDAIPTDINSPQRARQIFQAALRYAQGNSRPALSISPDCRGGIIIKKHHYSDFIGPGAAIVNRHDLQGNAVVPVGRLKFVPLKTPAQRQLALGKRVEYLRALEEMARSPVALRRSCQIVEHLCHWLTEADAKAIPDALVASLVGVMPMAIELAWRSYRDEGDEQTAIQFACEDSLTGDHLREGGHLRDEALLESQDAHGQALLRSRIPSLNF